MLTILMAAFPSSLYGSSGFDRAIEAASARVVKLYGLGAGQQEGYGTGVVVSPEGRVLTVLSLLLDAQTVRAIGPDGARYEARVLHRDRVRQLALLQLSAAPDAAFYGYTPRSESDAPTFAYFDVCQPSELSPGDWVVAAGNPFKVADGAEPVSVAHGVFSIRTPLDAMRRARDFPYAGDVLVIDAITSNPGASGSAVVNLDGAFVGMIGRVVISNLTNTHFNYAMPRDVLCDYYREATTTPAADGATTITEGTAGASSGTVPAKTIDLGIKLNRTGYQRVLPFVERVQSGSPAEKAGVRPDDLILSVNGKNVGDIADYERRLREIGSSERLTLVIRRGRTIIDVVVETGGSP